MQARKLPQTHAETVEFFLETESEEMEFETARCRPMLTKDFFGYLQQQISAPHIPSIKKLLAPPSYNSAQKEMCIM